jgi:hypothetical protein
MDGDIMGSTREHTGVEFTAETHVPSNVAELTLDDITGVKTLCDVVYGLVRTRFRV